jgi:putative transmembrane protein PGPGW
MRVAKIAVGFTLLGAGVVMLALPGPGLLTIGGALAILSTEYSWARRALHRSSGALARGAGALKWRRSHVENAAESDRAHHP